MAEKILVTGAAGFIGFHVSMALLKGGREVVGLDNFNDYYHPVVKEARAEILRGMDGYSEERLDLADYAALHDAWKRHRFGKICHLAAQAGVRYSISNPRAYEQANLAGFLNILELARHSETGRLVYASSSSVYGGNRKIPFAESDPVDHPISLYAATKKANELMAHCYTHLYGFQTVGLRFFTVYGPWGRPDMAMWLFAEAIAKGKPIKVFNHGEMRRDFTYVDDIVRGIIAALDRECLDKYEIFNLGNHRSEPLLRMISLIEEAMGRQAEKIMMPLQPGDVPESFADVELARQKLGFEPSTPIDAGIPAFIEWYRSHPRVTDTVAQSRGAVAG